MYKSVRAILAIVYCMGLIFIVGCGHISASMDMQANASGEAQAKSRDVSAQEALALWGNTLCVVIDVRTPEEYKEGHVPGATNIPLDQLEARMPEVSKDQKVLLICRSGRRSTEGTNLLRSKGYDHVYNVSGGMLAWKGPVKK